MEEEFVGRDLIHRKSDAVFWVILIVIVGLIVFHFASRIRVVSTPVANNDELLEKVAQAALDGKRTIYLKSLVQPDGNVLQYIFPITFNADMYIGAEIHHFQYTYKPEGAYYRVKVKLRSPSRVAAFFTKIRVRQIARHLNKLETDYDKVKAAHDYLAKLNKYNYIKGGAFSCLYGRESACNGYAYSFYLILKELNIPVTCDFGTNHVWNRVKLGEYWYNVDVTYDDPGKGVFYTYFLKCNADWPMHDYGLSDAPSSLPVTGRSASENYALVPNYHLIGIIMFLLLCVASFFAIRQLRRIHGEKELKRIEENLRREEEAKILFEEQLRKKQEEFARQELFFAAPEHIAEKYLKKESFVERGGTDTEKPDTEKTDTAGNPADGTGPGPEITGRQADSAREKNAGV